MIIAFGVVHVVLLIWVISQISALPESSGMTQFFHALNVQQDGSAFVADIVMACVSAYMILFSVLYFAVTQSIMKNHLNLE